MIYAYTSLCIYIITHQFHNFDGYQSVGGLSLVTRLRKDFFVRRLHFDSRVLAE